MTTHLGIFQQMLGRTHQIFTEPIKTALGREASKGAIIAVLSSDLATTAMQNRSDFRTIAVAQALVAGQDGSPRVKKWAYGQQEIR